MSSPQSVEQSQANKHVMGLLYRMRISSLIGARMWITIEEFIMSVFIKINYCVIAYGNNLFFYTF